MKLIKPFATAVVCAAFAFGGLSVAAAPQDDASKSSAAKTASTAKAKGLSATERRERQITADLNRRQLTQAQQVAQASTPAQPPAAAPPPPPLPQQQPAPSPAPAAP